MIVDSSAIIAMLLEEEDAPGFHALLANSQKAAISTGNVLELHIVAKTRMIPSEAMDTVLARYGVEIVPFSYIQLRLAIEAHNKYGKGRHPAGLNFGDCFAYALAKERDMPLLCKGEDFRKTDIAIARLPGA